MSRESRPAEIDAARRTDGIYVGYLDTPRRYLRASRVFVGFAMLLSAAAAFMLAYAMNDPGDAVWDTTGEQSLTGMLVIEPVPLLVTDDGPILLVEAGKFGLREDAADLANRPVRAVGFGLSREGWRMLELAPGGVGLELLGQSETTAAADMNQAGVGLGEPVVADGELIDSKCYLGAMKPGQGRSHKACATLCIRGGIPALFVGSDSEGRPVTAVVQPGPQGRLDDRWLGFIGEPVTIRGMRSSEHGLEFVDLESVTLRN